MIFFVFWTFVFFWVFANQPTTLSGVVSRGKVCGCGCGVSDKWQVTCNTLRVTHDTWQVTYDTWQVTPDMWHVKFDTWHIISFSLLFSSSFLSSFCPFLSALISVQLSEHKERFSVSCMQDFHKGVSPASCQKQLRESVYYCSELIKCFVF